MRDCKHCEKEHTAAQDRVYTLRTERDVLIIAEKAISDLIEANMKESRSLLYKYPTLSLQRRPELES